MTPINDLTIVILTDKDNSTFEASLASAQIASHVKVVQTKADLNLQQFVSKYRFSVMHNHQNQIKNFAWLRNSIHKQVQTTWVFWLDSDEVITNQLWTQLKQALKSDGFDGFYIFRKDVFLNKQLKFGEAGKMRLLRVVKTKQAKWQNNVHEKLTIAGRTKNLSGHLLHFAHHDLHEFCEKINMYSTLAANSHHKTTSLLKTCLYPAGKFVYNYFLRLGFLDGYVGFCYAYMMSLHSLAQRVKEYEHYKA